MRKKHSPCSRGFGLFGIGDQAMYSTAWRTSVHLSRAILIGLTLFASQAIGQIYHVEQMNTQEIKALEREKTVVLLPVGILEEHGPYLPSGADGYIVERRTQDLANAIIERPGWKVLIFPLIALGTGPANTVGRKYV